MRQGTAKLNTRLGLGPVQQPMDWDEDAETTYQQRPGANFSRSPGLSLDDNAWAPESPIRLTPPATGQWFTQPLHLPATEFGREFGYRRKRRSGRGRWWLVACAVALAGIALARVPRVQIEVAKLGTLADRLGVGEALTRLVSSVRTRTRNSGPPAANLETPIARNPASPAHGSAGETGHPPAGSATPAPRRTPSSGEQRVRHRSRPQRQPVEPTGIASEQPEPSLLESLSDEPPSPTPDTDGVLRINSLPWAEVSIDGDWVGTTPQREIKLRPGRHKIKLVNPEMQLVRIFAVQIKAGETVTKSIVLEP